MAARYDDDIDGERDQPWVMHNSRSAAASTFGIVIYELVFFFLAILNNSIGLGFSFCFIRCPLVWRGGFFTFAWWRRISLLFFFLSFIRVDWW